MGFGCSATDMLRGPLQTILLWSSVCYTNLNQKVTTAAAVTIFPAVSLDDPTWGGATTELVSLARFLGVSDVIMTIGWQGVNTVSMLVCEYKNTYAACTFYTCTFMNMYRFLPLCLFRQLYMYMPLVPLYWTFK